MTNATRVTSLIFVLLLTSGATQAQHRWSGSPHWYKDWLWWVGEATIAAIEATDAHSTILGRENCAGCVETNGLIGPRPNNRGVIGLSIVGFGIESLLHWGSWETCPDVNHESRSWRVACDMLIPGEGVAIRTHAIVHNYHLASQFKSASPSNAIQHIQLGRASTTSIPFPRGFSSQGSPLPPFLRSEFPGCGMRMTLCASLQATPKPKIDLRSVHFR